MVTKCRLARSSPDERREHIIAVAAEAFTQEGYGATSMSTIAARVGGSKATLYKYFPSKEALFGAVMEERCARVLAPLRDLRGSDSDNLEELMADFGVRFLTKIYEQGALDVQRMIYSDGSRFPELAAVFFRSGPDVVMVELADMLGRFREAGVIECEDLSLAAGQFLGMVRGDSHLRFTMGVQSAPPAEEVERQARMAARIFVRGLLKR